MCGKKSYALRLVAGHRKLQLLQCTLFDLANPHRRYVEDRSNLIKLHFLHKIAIEHKLLTFVQLLQMGRQHFCHLRLFQYFMLIVFLVREPTAGIAIDFVE